MNQNERDLLFGVLAIQVDLLTQEQLIAARMEWVDRREISLDEILMRQGAITRKQRDILDALVDAHLNAHGDCERSLSVASQAKDEILSSFQRLPTDQSGEPITRTDDDLPTLAVGKIGDNSGNQSIQGTRYRLLRLHQEGGLGRVYVAHDEELDRTVALKEIKETFADDAASQSRFILEAEITGGLEHPGVVPVYGFGRYKDARPFYAMRFVRGGSLRQAIRDFHEDPNKRKDPLLLRGLLRRFVDICNVMTYAHQRGVLHRDLKPNNVMLGQHGETLVVDWGLAKTLASEGAVSSFDVSDRSGPKSALVPRSGSTFDDTMLGKAIGSPPYMSPEQARGEHDQLGPATDIYSLGGILYSILTNRAPVKAESLNDVLQKVLGGEIDLPSDVARDVPKPLESVAMKALSMTPDDRYESVEALIQDVENYLADEPVIAHTESLGERLSRVGRRHRALVRSATVALLAITIVSLLAAVSLERQQQMTQREKTRGDRVLEHMVDAFSRPDPEIDGRSVKVAEVLDRAMAKAKSKLNEEPLAKASILEAIGKTYEKLGLPEEGLQPLELAFEIRKKHLGIRHLETLQSEFHIASAELGMHRAKESIARFERVIRQQEATLGRNHPTTFATRKSLAYAHVMADDPDKAIEIYETCLADFHADKRIAKGWEGVVSLMTGLAYAYAEAGLTEKAEKQVDESIAYARSKAGDDHTLTLSAIHQKAHLLHETGRIKDAISAFESAYEGRAAILGEMHGDTLSTANDLAVLYFHDKRYDDATDLLENVCRIRSTKFGDAHLLTRTARWNLAKTYATLNKSTEAAATLQRIADSLTSELPWQECVTILESLVVMYELSGDRDGAKSTYVQIAETNGISDEIRSRALRGVTHHALAQSQYTEALAAATRWVAIANGSSQTKALLCLADAQLGNNEVHAAEQTLVDLAKLWGDERPEYFEHLQAIVKAEKGDFAGAEPILRSTFPVIMSSEFTIKVSYRRTSALRRINAFYEKWGKPEKTANWIADRDEIVE